MHPSVRGAPSQSAGFNVLSEMQSLNDQLRRLVGDWNQLPSLLGDDAGRFAPVADVEETADEYLVEIELAGVDRDQIDVRDVTADYTDGVLTIRIAKPDGQRRHKSQIK
jgi:HSP20 family molecular chaperone IbpA